jgi:hypothetical protein
MIWFSNACRAIDDSVGERVSRCHEAQVMTTPGNNRDAGPAQW